MNSYNQTLKYLYGLQTRGMKFGLRNTRMLLRAVGNPERTFASIHIAGTNGKGSTAAFLASMFMEAGYRTGLYTSPHLIRFTERIRIDGVEIPEERLVRYADSLRPTIELVHATFFEATTCIAFQYFADERVDIAIVETGLGGRVDSTNLLKPLVSIITTIAFDHQEYLGNTIKSIAREKGGIIKPGVPLVTGVSDPEALGVLRRIAAKRRAPFHLVRGSHALPGGLRPGFSGPHQVLNARLAVTAVSLLHARNVAGRTFGRLDPAAVRRGLARVRLNTGLRARLEAWHGSKRILLDVAHNPDGIRTLIDALPSSAKGGLVVVFGVMRDKDYVSMVNHLVPVSKTLIVVSPRTGRALPTGELYLVARKAGGNVRKAGSVRNGVGRAMKAAGKSGCVLITGSHYVVGEALQFLEKGRNVSARGHV